MAQNPPNQTQVAYNDEVDLVEYVKVILARKWVVIIGTLLCILGGGIYKWLEPPIPQSYRATATLLVVPPPTKSELLPNFSSQIYQRLAEAQDLKKDVVDAIASQMDIPLSASALDGALMVQIVSRQEGVLENGPILLDFNVTLQDTSRLHPVLVANKWATLFVNKNRGFTSREAVGSYSYINDQYLNVKENLENIEDELSEFNKNNNLEGLKLEWNAKNSKSTEHQTTFFNLNFQLRTLRNDLAETDRAIAAQEMSNGTWLGDLALGNTQAPERINLTDSQKSIMQAVVQARSNFFLIKEKVRNFHLQNHMTLNESIIADKRAKMVAYLSELSQLHIDAGAVQQVLEDHQAESWPAIDLSAMSITEAGIRELTSLNIGYNLPKTRQRYVRDEIDRLKNEVDSLNQVHSKHSMMLEHLNSQLNLASENYQIFFAQYTALKKRRSELTVSMSRLKPEVMFHQQEITLLLKEIAALQTRIATLETQQVRLMREKGIYQATFDKFAKLLEDARIAKAAQPEDIKIVATAIGLHALPQETKGLSIFLIAIIGGGLSVFAAFFIEYWVQAKQRLQATS